MATLYPSVTNHSEREQPVEVVVEIKIDFAVPDHTPKKLVPGGCRLSLPGVESPMTEIPGKRASPEGASRQPLVYPRSLIEIEGKYPETA